MIKFINLSNEEPYTNFKKTFNRALLAGQQSIEAINISSYCKIKDEVNSRYVNLKVVEGDEFIFFSNYNSIKSKEFNSHNKISCTFYWASINTQIRMKAKIKKTTTEYNNLYFKNRSPEKNALAICSNQSQIVSSFDIVKEKYDLSLKNNNLDVCPSYWGGYSFTPFEIEFWKGNKYRLNKRVLFKKEKKEWKNFILEP